VPVKKWANETYHFVEGKPKMLPQYNQWFDMKQRCLSERSRKARPTYERCKLFESWLDYDNYVSWATLQVGHLQLDDNGKLYQLDKDLLGEGSYGPNSCVFIPQELNKFLTAGRGSVKVGCSQMDNGKWRVTIHDPFQKKNVHLGCFESLDQASTVHTEAKRRFAIKLADKWKGHIDQRAYQALLNKYGEIK
jgi:hypothetical protein